MAISDLGKGLDPCRPGARADSRRAVQIRLDGRDAGPEAGAVDLEVLHYTLNIVACLGERDAFDPVNRIDFGIARIAVLDYPVSDPPRAGVIAGERHDV